MKASTFSPNHIKITSSEGVYLQSYETVVAFIPSDKERKTQLDKKWTYSNTTTKNVIHFLGEPSSKEISRKIKTGSIS